jgi:serine/threonine-protein kinase
MKGESRYEARAPAAPPSLGELVAGKYRVERVLGQGGMGVVVVARHLQLGEKVAIKFPLARLAGRDDVLARWVREGRAAMRIRSMHVTRVYDVGVLETGQPYLVMEYLVGRDLAAVLADRGPLPLHEVVEHVLQCTEALAEAHAQGIIHRDLKPSNLFLTRGADGSPVIKVLDFGMAKTSYTGLETPVTGPAAVIGTPHFMAPEQMRADREIDVRADIWALGATLHTLLTGKPPFSGGSLVELHEAALLGPPALRTLRPDAPAALEAVLLRAMQVDPAARYLNVGELAEALAEVAPEHARVSALRVARVLSTMSRDAPPSESSLGPHAAEDATLSQSPATDSTAKASWLSVESTAGREVRIESASGAARSPQPRARRWMLPVAIVIGLAGTLGVVMGGLNKLRTRPRDPSTEQAAGTLSSPGSLGVPNTSSPPSAVPLFPSQPQPSSTARAAEHDAGVEPKAPSLRSLVSTNRSTVLDPSRPAPAIDAGPLVEERARARSPEESVPARDPLADPN